MEVRHPQVAQQTPPLACGLAPIRRSPVGASAASSGMSRPSSSKSSSRLVALHPALELGDVLGMCCVHEERHLVRPERALDLQAIHDLRAPSTPSATAARSSASAAASWSLRSPARSLWIVRMSSMARSSAPAMSWCMRSRLVALDEIRRPAAAAEELLQLLGLDARQDGRVADLVAVQVQDRAAPRRRSPGRETCWTATPWPGARSRPRRRR